MRVGYESFCCLARTAHVAASDTTAAYVEFADHLRGDWLKAPIQDISPRSSERAADRDPAVAIDVVSRAVKIRAVDRRLGESIGIDHPAAGSYEPAKSTIKTPSHRV